MSLSPALNEWVAFAANIVTILGVTSIAWTFHVSVSMQAKMALLREIETLRADPGVAFTGETKDLFNVILHWANNSAFAGGPGSEAFSTLDAAGRQSYRAWVAYVVALFDLALLDGRVRKDAQTRVQMLTFLMRHADALKWSWPRIGMVGLSDDTRRLVAEVIRAETLMPAGAQQ